MNAAEDDDLLAALAVADHSHRVVADEVHLVAVVRVLDADPDLLVQQEQVNVIEQRGNVLLAEAVVTAACHDNRGVDGEVAHRVAKAGAGRLTCRLNRDEFSLNDFPIDSHRLEILQFIHKFPVCLLTTKVVDTVLNGVRLSDFELIFLDKIPGRDDGTSTTLNHGLHRDRTLLELQLDPLARVHVEHDHVLAHHTVLCLATVDDHGALVGDRTVILARANRNTFALEHLDRASCQVILEDLVGALTNHALAIELEAASEDKKLVLVLDRAVALATLDLLL